MREWQSLSRVRWYGMPRCERKQMELVGARGPDSRAPVPEPLATQRAPRGALHQATRYAGGS